MPLSRESVFLAVAQPEPAHNLVQFPYFRTAPNGWKVVVSYLRLICSNLFFRTLFATTCL